MNVIGLSGTQNLAINVVRSNACLFLLIADRWLARSIRVKYQSQVPRSEVPSCSVIKNVEGLS